MALDPKRIKQLSDSIKAISNGSVKKPNPIVALPGIHYTETPAETPESIASKLNSRQGVLNSSVIFGLPTAQDIAADVVKELKTGKTRLEAKDILNLPQTNAKRLEKFDMNDQRWHGAGSGLSEVSHDATLTGDGTPGDPLSVVAGAAITDLTGDATATGPGSVPITLATVNTDIGSFTNASITVNGKGLITAASSGAAATGTVTSVSVVSQNGLAGTVATATTTPAITLSTTVTGILKGNGTAISAGVAGDVDPILPTQTGNSGEFLTTNGTNSSWAAIAIPAISTPTGTVNGVNDTFTTATQPQIIFADGMARVEGIDYTYLAGTITMVIPPSIFIRVLS